MDNIRRNASLATSAQVLNKTTFRKDNYFINVSSWMLEYQCAKPLLRNQMPLTTLAWYLGSVDTKYCVSYKYTFHFHKCRKWPLIHKDTYRAYKCLLLVNLFMSTVYSMLQFNIKQKMRLSSKQDDSLKTQTCKVKVISVFDSINITTSLGFGKQTI